MEYKENFKLFSSNLFLTTSVPYSLSWFLDLKVVISQFIDTKNDFKNSQLHTNINELLNTNAMRLVVLKTILSDKGNCGIDS